jgi:hypothetical protein
MSKRSDCSDDDSNTPDKRHKEDPFLAELKEIDRKRTEEFFNKVDTALGDRLEVNPYNSAGMIGELITEVELDMKKDVGNEWHRNRMESSWTGALFQSPVQSNWKKRVRKEIVCKSHRVKETAERRVEIFIKQQEDEMLDRFFKAWNLKHPKIPVHENEDGNIIFDLSFLRY